MKWSFLLFSSFLCLQAIAQYPATGNKMRLGWQTTGDGLVYRGAIGDTATLDPSGINNAWMLLDTANGNLYAYRAKAWQLVSGGGGGGLTMPFDSVTFNVNETDASQRELKYSEEKGYLQYGGLDSVQIPLLPGIWYVRNDTSVTIPKGTVVRATGTLGASGRIKVKHMIANGTIDAMYVLGIAMQDIAVGADGYAMSQGKIRKINTQAYSEGAVLYADVDTLGGLTQTEPTGSNLKLPIAFVVHSASNGTLAVRVSPGTYLRDLHDAYITSPDSSASLYYNSSEGIWRDTTGAVYTSDTSVFARDFQISGTTNYLAKFTGSNAVGNSVIQDNGTNVGISASPSSFKLDINGSTHTTGDFYADRAARSASAGFVSAQTNNRWLAGMISNSGSWHVYDLLRSTSVMTLDSATGNVGINTTTPAYRLDVNGDVNTTGMYKKSGTDIISGTTNYIPKFTGSNTIGNSGFIENGQEVYLGGTANAFNFSRFSIYFNPVNNGFPVVADTRAYNSAQPVRGGWAFAGKYDSIGNYTAFGQIAAYKENTSNQQKNGFLQFSTISNADAFPEERMRITSAGNVGISTSSPSRPLHVAGTTAIRIPVGNFAQRGTSDNGDIRVRTDTASMEYYSGAWRTVAPMARVPQSGLANRFSKFDANGLLDTSAILIQANNRIGIFNSPAAGDSALTVTGSGNFTTGLRVGGRVRVGGSQTFSDTSRYQLDVIGTGRFTTQTISPTIVGGIANNNNLTFRATLGTSSDFNNLFRFRGGLAASPDTVMEIGYYNSGGTVGIPTVTNYSYALNVNGGIITDDILAKNTGPAKPQSNFWNASNDQTASYFNFQKSRGAAATAIVQDGDEVGNFGFGASNGNTGFYSQAQIKGIVSGPPVNLGIVPVDFIFYTSETTTNAIPNLIERMRITYNGKIGVNTNAPKSGLDVRTSFGRGSPVSITSATYTVDSLTNWIICNRTSTITLTLPTASSWTGREIMIKTIEPQAVISASSNVVPLIGGAAGTSILGTVGTPPADGAWCTLVSDGTNWIIMQRGS